ncbi:MAG: SDR family NAD(P)-dependent oxidoreductase [Thermoleophilia bacterium]|nr:SDR family NAD(P)-dependent oxidoreductase [Thermoleophilia bacterium]
MRGLSDRGSQGYRERYGAWALVAGASEGLGAAFAQALAARGMDLVLVARRRAPLDELAEELRRAKGVQVRCYDGDLASEAFLQTLVSACSDLDLGLVVCNAAQAPIGDFASRDPGDLMRVVDVNVRSPLLLLRALLPQMKARGRGGAILMTSLTGNLGTPGIAAYASSKAFLRVLGESLWYELKDQGIDVLACICGAVRTPGYTTAAGKDAPGTLDAEVVVERALRALGRGPVVMPGFVNRVATVFMTKLLPRRTAIGILARSTRGLAQVRDTKGES